MAIQDHTTTCGALRGDGTDCTGAIVPDAPINLCMNHLQKAAEFYDTIAVTPIVLAKCPRCGTNGMYKDRGKQLMLCQQMSCGYSAPISQYNDERRELDLQRRQQIKQQGEEPAVIYYILFGERVKIGFSKHLKARLADLPYERLLALEPGGRQKESERHRQFAAQRMPHSEWFERTTALDEHIASLRNKYKQLARLADNLSAAHTAPAG